MDKGWAECMPPVKDISNILMGEISLTEVYMHPIKNRSTMRCLQEEKHIKGNEHIKKERAWRDVLTLG